METDKLFLEIDNHIVRKTYQECWIPVSSLLEIFISKDDIFLSNTISKGIPELRDTKKVNELYEKTCNPNFKISFWSISEDKKRIGTPVIGLERLYGYTTVASYGINIKPFYVTDKLSESEMKMLIFSIINLGLIYTDIHKCAHL